MKNIRISKDILRRVFHILTEPVPYTLVSVNRRNNDWVQASLFRRSTDTNVYGSVKIWKTRRKISLDIRIFFIV